jgi:tetratricopeptide (TPR) repeat protein
VLEEAIGLFEPKESIYLMLFSSYYEEKQLDKAADTLIRMIRCWPEKKKYWMQLAALYLEQKKCSESLEIMQAASAQGYLIEEKDILQYVYTLYEENLPHKAAAVLDQAIRLRVVTATRKHFELLSTLYQEARDREKAIDALKQAADFSTDGKNDLCIAQLYFEMDNAYEDAIEFASRAISKGISKTGNAHMLIAVSYSELGQTEKAKSHLIEAGQHDETRDASLRWLESLSERDRDTR